MIDELRIVPANEASAEDLDALFDSGDPARCRCQWLKVRYADWRALPVPERAARLHEQSRCGDPQAARTTGLVAYLNGEPAGWCAVESRSAYPRLLTARVPWTGRTEDRQDGSVWAVTCFVTRPRYRRRGVGRALARAAVGFARDRGARAVEGYPIANDASSGTIAERYVGTEGMFAEAGFLAVSRPSAHRVVMRIDFND
jgi:GNAT superfamily N-acetyltransferase